jgi:hypothetical protein
MIKDAIVNLLHDWASHGSEAGYPAENGRVISKSRLF